MSNDNLLLALRRCAPSDDRDPRENLITEAFAWLLRSHPGLAATFLARLTSAKPLPLLQLDPGSVHWRTQVVEKGARFDVVAESDSAALEGSGESAAADLVKNLGDKADLAKELCYRLYTLCERKKRATEAMSYNGLVQSWPEIVRLSRGETTKAAAIQGHLGFGDDEE